MRNQTKNFFKLKVVMALGVLLTLSNLGHAQVGDTWVDTRDNLNLDIDGGITGGALTIGALQYTGGKYWTGMRQTAANPSKYSGLLIDSDRSSTYNYNIWMQGKEVLLDANFQRFKNRGSGIIWGSSNWTNTFSKIYDNGQLHIQTDDNFYIDDITNTGSGAATNVFYINTNSGKVGIGTNTTSLNQFLEVKPDTDNSGVIGKAHIGNTGYVDWAGFSHFNRASEGNYALMQNESGKTLVNASTNQTVDFRIMNKNRMVMSEFGTGNYEGKFDVLGNLVIGNMTYLQNQIVINGYSTAQQQSHSAAKGHLNAPWTYTHAIEAPNERGTASTMILIGDAGDFTTTGLSEVINSSEDQLHFITNGKDRFNINSLGEAKFSSSVGIGTNAIAGFLLGVKGKVKAEEMELTYSNWPDYVFTDKHHRATLSEVKTFIELNGHLPNVKSAKEVEKNGLGVAEASQMMMEKIEELTLYVIELQDQINALKNQK